MNGSTAALVDRGDLDELGRQANRLCAAGDWDRLEELRWRCRAAHERGRQLWPVASRCEYLLALHAPAARAAAVVVEGAGAFAPGPLAEVVAASHPWVTLDPHLEAGPLRTVVAHERVLRGEDLSDASLAPALEVAPCLQSWEPAYPLATYRDDGMHVPTPTPREVAPLEAAASTPRGATVDRGVYRQGFDDPVVAEALRSLVRTWCTHSEGRAAVASVAGTAEEAITSLAAGPVGAVEVTPGEALAVMAWAAASGGAHGRRRGAAAGRTDAWWAAAAFCGLEETWPVDPVELGEATAELRWLRWSDGAATRGWYLLLAVEDPADGLAWAIRAVDTGSPTESGATASPAADPLAAEAPTAESPSRAGGEPGEPE